MTAMRASLSNPPVPFSLNHVPHPPYALHCIHVMMDLRVLLPLHACFTSLTRLPSHSTRLAFSAFCYLSPLTLYALSWILAPRATCSFSPIVPCICIAAHTRSYITYLYLYIVSSRLASLIPPLLPPLDERASPIYIIIVEAVFFEFQSQSQSHSSLDLVVSARSSSCCVRYALP